MLLRGTVFCIAVLKKHSKCTSCTQHSIDANVTINLVLRHKKLKCDRIKSSIHRKYRDHLRMCV